MRHLVFGLVMALLLSTAAMGSGPGANAFITNGMTSISLLDTATNNVTSVDIGAATQGVAVDPKGRRAYVVAANGSPSSVYAIDTNDTNNRVSLPFPLTVRSPYGVAVSLDGATLFVTHGVKIGRNPAQGALSAINVVASTAWPVTLSLGPTVRVCGGATGVAVSPSGNRVYVGNASQRVSVVDPTQIGAREDIPCRSPAVIANVVASGAMITGLAVAPNGVLYAADYANGKLLVLDIAGVTTDVVVDCAAPTAPLAACVNVGSGPFGVAVSANGRRVFVANSGSKNVTVIDPAKIGTPGELVATTIVGEGPHGVAVTSDSARAYVVNRVTTPATPSTPAIPPSVSVLDMDGRLLATIGLPVNSSPVGFGNFLTTVRSIPVTIDVVPKGINPKAQGSVPVIIHGAMATDGAVIFDVYTADLSTICFNGWPVKEKPNGDWMANYADFNGDGVEDVMIHVDMKGTCKNGFQSALLSSSNTVAALDGQTKDGVPFHGSESVIVH